MRSKALYDPPGVGWMCRGKLILQPYAYTTPIDWLHMMYRECPKLLEWHSENATVKTSDLINVICEVLDKKCERVEHE
jgi:hypothetical protein